MSINGSVKVMIKNSRWTYLPQYWS